MATSPSTTTTAHNSQVFISSRVTLFKFANGMQVLRFNMVGDWVPRQHNNHHNGWSDAHYNSTITQMEAIVNVYQSQVRSDDDDDCMILD